MDRVPHFSRDFTFTIYRLPKYIKDASQGCTPDWYSDGPIFHLSWFTTFESFGTFHGNAADGSFAQELLHFTGDTLDTYCLRDRNLHLRSASRTVSRD